MITGDGMKNEGREFYGKLMTYFNVYNDYKSED